LYLKGRYFWERRTTPDLERAVEYFSEAVARDPSYAEAHAGLADAQILRAVLSNRPPAETLPLARAALAEALRLGTGIAVVHAANGNLLSAFDWHWPEAEAQLQLAIELDAGLIIARIYLAIHLQHVGRFDEAIEVATSALVFDPLSSGLNLTLGRAYLHARRPAEALQPLKTAVEIAPGLAFAHQQIGHALLQLGRSAEAIDAFRRAAMSGGPIDAGQLAFALATTGDRVAAEAVVRDLLAMEATGYLPPYGVACAYAGLGDLDAAFAWLNRGIDEHAAHMNTIRVVPALYPLHGDRRWRDVLTRMGWPSPS
jgi:serine/threonine-protein kinase